MTYPKVIRFATAGLAVVSVMVAVAVTHADTRSTGKRVRSLTSDAEVRQIRASISQYPRAKEIADKIVREADEWVARPDHLPWEMIPPSDIPRAFNSSFDGCPVHGTGYFKHGNYSWKMDPFGKPWKLVCPVGGEEYPSNDFMAYYKTRDRSLLTGDFPDDGWGWLKPGDEKKHWFAAYYCHWLWLNYIVPSVDKLALAYQVTGDEKYARKAIVMLDRIAELYPSMDHNKQSRYAAEFSPSYRGKIVNLIWETGLVSTLTSAYDNVFDVLAADGAFTPPDGDDSPLAGKTNAEIRRNIEQNLLQVAVQGVFDGTIRGNYGMHQRTLLKLAVVLQDDDLTKRVCDYILNNSSGDLSVEGFNYALDNLVLREGIAFESAPGYCLSWSANLATVGDLLDKLGVDIFADPKFKWMFTAYLQLRVLDKFTPAIGDSGSVASGAIGLPSGLARMCLRKFDDSVFARYLLHRGIFAEKSFESYADLKFPILEEGELAESAEGAPDPSAGSRNLGGYGLAIMEAGAGDDQVGASVYYGPAEAGHAHYDRLSLELYGYGRKLIPDLGYPQFAAEAKDPAAWERNTLSHCTVTVNASRQATKRKGILNDFSITPDVKLLDVSAPDAYPDLEEYRRVLLLLGGESESPYLVDFFIVKGGQFHDYSLHGFDGEFRTEGIELSPVQEKGTLAGEDVPYSFLYDDPDLEKPGKTRSYHSYLGSGYSYLYSVQRAVPAGTWAATWADKECGIRAIFPRQDLTEAVIASGNPPKRPGSPESLKYVLVRNSGAGGLASRFSCVLQPFRTGDAPLKVRRIPSDGGDLLEIKGPHGTDYVYLAGDSRNTVEVGGLSISGACAVLRMDSAGRLKSAFVSGGGHVRQGLLSVEAGPALQGCVTEVNLRRNEVTLEAENSTLSDGELAGRTILFGRTNYVIHRAEQRGGRVVIGLGEDSPRTGKLVVDSIDPEGRFVSTRTLLYFAAAGCYKDAWLANEDLTSWRRVADVERGRVVLQEPADLRSDFADTDGDGRITAYLYDVAPGQEYVIPAVCWVGRDESAGWRLESNSPARATLPDGTKLQKGYPD